jgi:hypothetical protein
MGHLLLNDLTSVDVRDFLDSMPRDSTRAIANGHLFHDPMKDVDLMDTMECGLMAA